MTHGERQTKGRGRLFESVVETVGDTPCIRVNNLAPNHATVYVICLPTFERHDIRRLALTSRTR